MTTFADLVRDDLRSSSPDPRLREPDHLEQWRSELVCIIQDIDAQMSKRRGELNEVKAVCLRSGTEDRYRDAESSFNRWKASALQAKRYAVARLAEAKELLKQARIQDADNDTRDQYRRLRQAVAEHREATEDRYDPTPADLALWDVLDDLTVPSHRGAA